MNNYEFLEYKAYKQDDSDPQTKFNPLASATIRIDKKYTATYFQRSFQGKPPYWTEISASVFEDGEKTHLKGFMADSRTEEKAIIDFIKDNVKRLTTPQVAMSASLGSQQVYSHHQQAAQYNQQAAQFKQEVAADEPLPF